MARQPKPWYWKDRKFWCVTINGQRHNLGPNKREAMQQFRALLQQPVHKKVVAHSLVSIIDNFLDWVKHNRAPDTFEWYHCRLQSFVTYYPELSIEQLRPLHVENWAALLD